MAEAFGIEVRCSECGKVATRAALRWIAPTNRWEFEYEGIEAGGPWLDIDDAEADTFTEAFRLPLNFARVRIAALFDNAGFCPECELPYCSDHWSPSETGFGTCPRGHGHSLDPHWSPDGVD